MNSKLTETQNSWKSWIHWLASCREATAWDVFLTQNNLLHSNSDSLKLVFIEEREGGNDCQVLHEKGCHDLAPQVLFANVAWSGFKTSITALTFQWDQAKQFDKLCYYDRMLWNKYLKGTIKNKWCIGLAQIWPRAGQVQSSCEWPSQSNVEDISAFDYLKPKEKNGE